MQYTHLQPLPCTARTWPDVRRASPRVTNQRQRLLASAQMTFAITPITFMRKPLFSIVTENLALIPVLTRLDVRAVGDQLRCSINECAGNYRITAIAFFLEIYTITITPWRLLR